LRPTGTRSRTHSRLGYIGARARLYSLEHWGVKLGLQNITDFCERLGRPQDHFLSLHIAGTNGKGSVAAFLDAILRAAGYRVGRYTSPHLRDFRERIHINGAPVPANWIAQFVECHWTEVAAKQYTYFEVATALAFDSFARAGIDVAVVEVGLGGRFDATNIIDPALAVITRIARDHEHVLGHTPEAIAFEKAGILKPGVPAVIGPMDERAESTIRAIANERGAPLWSAAELLVADANPLLSGAATHALRIPLAGQHQTTNLAIAVAAASLADSVGIALSAASVAKGVAGSCWPARFQIDKGKPTVVYDAAHNPDGIRSLIQTWKDRFGQARCAVVFDARTDKNFQEMIRLLAPITSAWVGCPLPGAPGISADTMGRLVKSQGVAFDWEESPRAALRKAKLIAGARGLVLLTGSHFLVGAVIPAGLLGPPSRAGARLRSVSFSQLLAAAKDRGAAF
jgi:dihydrofolate synthase/folylpolyglutamate synthase